MKRFGKKQFGFITLLFVALLFIAPTPNYADTTGSHSLTILHTNDSHSHVEMYPKLTTAVKEQRALQPSALLLDDGDVFNGTAYFDKYKGKASLWFMNSLSYDAMTFGNHEFSQNANVLGDFIKGMNFPMISSNIDVTKNTTLTPLYRSEISSSPQGGNIYPAIIKTIDGQQVGIFGILSHTSTTAGSTPIKNIKNQDYTSKAKSTIAALQRLGINKIIVLSHIGYSGDQQLAKSVSGIDVIIGGDSHTVLSSPAVIKKTEPTVIVQTGAFLNYLGVLNVSFDDNGIVTEQDGELLALKNYTADPAAQQKLSEYK